MSNRNFPTGGYNSSYPSRPKSKKVEEDEFDLDFDKERVSDEDEKHLQKEFVPLKVLWKQQSKHPRVGNESDMFKPSRKIEVVAPQDTPKPINRRNRMENFVTDESQKVVEKKRFFNKFKKNKPEVSGMMFSMMDLDQVQLDDTPSNLPDDFEYDLKLYNSPQSKPVKGGDGKMRMCAHPCYNMSQDRELMYRRGQKPKQEVPVESNMNLDKRLSDQLREMLKTPAMPRYQEKVELPVVPLKQKVVPRVPPKERAIPAKGPVRTKPFPPSVPPPKQREIPAVPPRELGQAPRPPPREQKSQRGNQQVKESNRSRPLPPIGDMPQLRKLNRPKVNGSDKKNI